MRALITSSITLAFMMATPSHAGLPLPLDTRLDPPSAAHIALALDRLEVVGSVLYVAAHPDDENTRLLAWLAGERGLFATYVSLTRGDGGQNLVGSELGPLLGLIRTHELVAARAIDGAEQRFTRAVDFGYSKSAEETLGIWGKDEVLADLVRVVRETRPDVIVTRFSTEPPNHGHHTASALLAREAFVAAADPQRFPAQLGALAPHQANRLLENKSPWRFKEGEDLSRYLALDVGAFDPRLGRAWAELAAASRTMHKSQGFGAAPALGEQLEYFEWTLPAGAAPAGAKDPLVGLDFTWARYPKTEALRQAIATARASFDPRRPERSIEALARVRDRLLALPADNPWRERKLAEVDGLIVACAGLVLDARATAPVVVPGEATAVKLTALVRSGAEVTLEAITWPDGRRVDPKRPVRGTKPDVIEAAVTMPATTPPSTPYWLRAPRAGGLFTVAPGVDPTQPLGTPDLLVEARVKIAGLALTLRRPVRFAWVDQVHGERFRPVEVLPPVTVTPGAPVLMLPTGRGGAGVGRFEVTVKAHGAVVPRDGAVVARAPAGWKVTPERQPFTIGAADGEATLVFEVASTGDAPQAITLDVEMAGSTTRAWRRTLVEHVHVPITTVLAPATVRAVPLAITLGGKRVGYIQGAGDEVAAGLAQVGYEVTTLDPGQLGEVDLSRFDAIVAGVRAYNVAPALAHAHGALMRYVERGGTYVVQYQTSNRMRRLTDTPIGPFPFTIDQGRVTDEKAELRWTDPKHPALTSPNRIGPDDLGGWVQERGLYFADTWDPRYTPLFEANDPGDKPLAGGAIVARHGKGAFVYTGLAFFRQLPEGVPGAYRLLANLLALGRSR
ncbi:MAG: PIG-L family deacetylase [Deltaproteobacteria bacterium]|nr:PIG-L family deacetylase [Deltaproteobacteria bacterium]